MKALAAVATTVATLLVAGGCSSAGSDEGAVAAAGDAAAAPTVTLRIGTDDFLGRPSADQIEHFAERVAELSEGTIEIEPVWHANDGGPGDDWDQRVARKVTAGELDGALVPARAWDTEGVDSFRPLHAPFLVDSHELLAEVISGDLADRMLAGLDGSGVVGLAMFPEGLRHPFGLVEPLLGPSDYDGAVLRVPTSDTSKALFEALGAQTNDDGLDRTVHDGVESGFVLKPGGVATGNVTLFPKVNVLVLGEEAVGDLDEADREILGQAAADTQTWAVESFPSESSLADEFCAAGGVVVHAGDSEVEALRAAVQPVLEDIRSGSAENAALLDAIAAIKSGLPEPQPARPCGEAADAEADGDQTVLTGVYRMEVTRELMLEAWPDTPADQIDNNVGTWTISMNDGRHYVHGTEFTEIVDGGSYRIDGDRVSFTWGDSTTAEVLEWAKDDDGSLVFSIVNVPDQFRFVYARPWEPVPELDPWEG